MSNSIPQFPEKNTLFNLDRIINQQDSPLVLTLLRGLRGVLMRLLSTSSASIAQEVVGTRAYMAANSVMQAILLKLFPLNRSSTCPLAPLAPSVSSHNVSSPGMNINGLYHCTAEASSNWYATHPDTGEKFYRLTSKGKCASSVLVHDSKDVVSSRTIQVEARSSYMCIWILSTYLPSVTFPYVNFIQTRVDKLTAISIEHLKCFFSGTSTYIEWTQFSQIKSKGISL